jgi:quercetin dioxygenase-like cupin family protein
VRARPSRQVDRRFRIDLTGQLSFCATLDHAARGCSQIAWPQARDNRRKFPAARAAQPASFFRAGNELTHTEQTMNELAMIPRGADSRALVVKHKPASRRYYFDVGIGSFCLSGADTGDAYCLLEISLAPGTCVPRHTHTREDESYFVLAGELEVIVGDDVFVLKPGDTLIAPREIPHELRNSGNVENHYLLVFSPAGFEEFLEITAVPAAAHAAAPTEPHLTPIRNVHALAGDYGIEFG